MLRAKEINLSYPEIWRVFISGSSSSGKTHFARQLLQTGLIRTNGIYYFHPDLEEEFPCDWDTYFPNVVFTAGLPSLDDLQAMPQYSTIVLDDLFEECSSSKLISYLFRVLSSKKKLNVIIMTQRYFEGGSNGLNLRNSSNFHVLLNNSDVRTNSRVGCQMGLNCEVKKALEINKSKLYPYIVIDRTNQARVNGVQTYINILDDIKEVIIKNCVMQVIPKREFDRKYTITDGFARKRSQELSDSESDEEYTPSESEDSSDDDIDSDKDGDDIISDVDDGDSSDDDADDGDSSDAQSDGESDDESDDESDGDDDDADDGDSSDDDDADDDDESVDESDDESDDDQTTVTNESQNSEASDSSDESQVGNGPRFRTKRYRSDISDEETNQYRPPTSRFRQTQESDCDCSECEDTCTF